MGSVHNFSVLSWLWSITWFIFSWTFIGGHLEKGEGQGKNKSWPYYCDVWKYFIFKADFSACCREILFRRRCHHYSLFMFGTRTSEVNWIICSDLKSTWNHLDQKYSDPRIVSDDRASSDSRLCSPDNINDSVT